MVDKVDFLREYTTLWNLQDEQFLARWGHPEITFLKELLFREGYMSNEFIKKNKRIHEKSE